MTRSKSFLAVRFFWDQNWLDLIKSLLFIWTILQCYELAGHGIILNPPLLWWVYDQVFIFGSQELPCMWPMSILCENFCLLSDQIWGFGPNMGFWKRMNFTSCFVKQYWGIIKGFSRIPMEEEDDEQYFGCSISHVFNSYDLFPFSRKIWYLSSLHPWQNIELGCMKVIYINCALKISSLL